MTPDQKRLVRETWKQVVPTGEAAADLLYRRLFEIDPTARELFRTTDMFAQRQKLLQTLGFAVSGLDNLDLLMPTVEDLGRRHAGYGVTDAHYDSLAGGAGNDVYFVDDAGDVVVENVGGGTDAVFSTVSHTLAANVQTLVLQGAGNLSGTGNALSNTIHGNSGDNTLVGAAGQDQLVGAQGNDVLVGGAGVDSLFGGIGQDTFFFTGTNLDTLDTGRGANRDVIHDFSGDLLHLVQIDANLNVATDQAFSFIGTNAFTAAGQVRFFADGAGNTIVEGNMDTDLGADFQIELRSFTGQLQAGDFLL